MRLKHIDMMGGGRKDDSVTICRILRKSEGDFSKTKIETTLRRLRIVGIVKYDCEVP